MRGAGSAPITRPPLRALLVAAILLPGVATLPAGAQTILNVERFQLADVDGTHAALTLSGSGQFGNTRVVQGGLEGIVGHVGDRHWPRVILGGSYLRQAGQDPILDNRFVQLRYSWLLSSRARTFHFVQLQRNETLRLRSRWLIGSGARRELYRSEATSLDAGTGLMYEDERLDPEAIGPNDRPESRTWRMANLAVLRHELDGGPTVTNITYFQPDVTGPGDFRLLSELALSFPLGEVVSMTLAADWRHDSRPPEALRRDDLSLRVGLTLETP